MGSAFFGIGYWAHFRHFRFLTTPWSKFDHVVVPSQKKPFAVPKSHKDTIYFLRGARGPVSCGLYGFETCLDSAMAQNCKCLTQFSCMTDFKRVTNSYKPHETEPWAPHRTYIVPLWLLGTAKGFFCDGTTTWSNFDHAVVKFDRAVVKFDHAVVKKSETQKYGPCTYANPQNHLRSTLQLSVTNI